MLYGISAVFNQMPFLNDAVSDDFNFALDVALDLGALDVAGAKPPRQTPERQSSTR
jgi:hypothetical protein